MSENSCIFAQNNLFMGKSCKYHNTDYRTKRVSKRLLSTYEDDYVIINIFLNCYTNLKEYVITRKLSSAVVVVQDSLFID